MSSGFGSNGNMPPIVPAAPGARRRPSASADRHAIEEATGRRRDLVDGGVERLLVLAGRLPVPAHLPHELQRGGADLFLGGDLIRPTERLDASAHAANGTASRGYRRDTSSRTVATASRARS